MKEKNKLQNQNGVTLIALVITIIVLIILAMISIAMLTGENGLLNKSLEAKIENAHGEIRERLELETQYLLAERLAGTSTEDLMTYLKGKNYVNDNGVVNIKELTKNSNLVTGKGSAESGKDIYKVEEKATGTGSISKIASTEPVKIASTEIGKIKEYSINYYDEKGNKTEIGLIIDNPELGNTEASSTPKEIISFKVFSSQWNDFECEKGMTWSDFVASKYNKDKAFTEEDNYIKYLGKYVQISVPIEHSSGFTNKNVEKTDEIKANEYYNSN